MNVLITGASGFVGRAMLARMPEGVQVYAVSRKPRKPSERVKWIQCDLDGGNLRVPMSIDAVVHLAGGDPKTEVARMKRMALVAKSARAKLVFASSGVALRFDSEYARAKLEAEVVALAYSRTVIARLYSFVGSGHAFDEFCRKTATLQAIYVTHPDVVRSWMHPDDLGDWMWAATLRGEPDNAYSIGAERGISMWDLVKMVVNMGSPLGFAQIEDRSGTYCGLGGTYYVPDTRWTMHALGVRETVTLEESIRRTLAEFKKGGDHAHR